MGTDINDRGYAVVFTKPWYKSMTLAVNGGTFVIMTFVAVMNVLTGYNALNPLIGVFVKDPQTASNVVAAIVELYSMVNIFLRFKTKAPVTI